MSHQRALARVADVRTNPPWSGSDPWTAVAEGWDTHAEAVEEHSAPMTAALLERVAVLPGDRVLELAAGPGGLAQRWSTLTGSDGTVLLTDVSEAMVAAAGRRSAALRNVDAQVMDASHLELTPASYDVVACRMGLMFVNQPEATLTSIRRALRRGGRFGALTWAQPEHNPWLTVVVSAAWSTGIVSDLPRSSSEVFSLSDGRELKALAIRSGFVGVRVDEIEVCFRPLTLAEHVRQICDLAPPLALPLSVAPPDRRASLVDAIVEAAAAQLADTTIALPGRALLLSGHV